jgi:hypothetical protein
MGVSGGAAKEINVFAKVTSPRSTLIADAAVTRWINGYPIARFQRRHPGAAFHNFTGDFVTEDHRLPDFKIGYTALVKIVEIRPADAAGAQPDQYFISTRFRDISVF